MRPVPRPVPRPAPPRPRPALGSGSRGAHVSSCQEDFLLLGAADRRPHGAPFVAHAPPRAAERRQPLLLQHLVPRPQAARRTPAWAPRARRTRMTVGERGRGSSSRKKKPLSRCLVSCFLRIQSTRPRFPPADFFRPNPATSSAPPSSGAAPLHTWTPKSVRHPVRDLDAARLFPEGEQRGRVRRAFGEGGRNARRQGCIGRRSSPGTWIFPRSPPPRAALTPCFHPPESLHTQIVAMKQPAAIGTSTSARFSGNEGGGIHCFRVRRQGDPGTRLFPRSQPPRAPLAPACPTLRNHSTHNSSR